jgi:peroxin-7
MRLTFNNYSDMSVLMWDLSRPDPLIERLDHHTEFVVGLDFNMFIEGQMASCSWDESVAVWNMLGRRGR